MTYLLEETLYASSNNVYIYLHQKRASLADLQFKASKFSSLTKEQQQIERNREIRRSKRRRSKSNRRKSSSEDRHVHFRENGTSGSLADGATLIDHVELNHVTDLPLTKLANHKVRRAWDTYHWSFIVCI